MKNDVYLSEIPKETNLQRKLKERRRLRKVLLEESQKASLKKTDHKDQKSSINAPLMRMRAHELRILRKLFHPPGIRVNELLDLTYGKKRYFGMDLKPLTSEETMREYEKKLELALEQNTGFFMRVLKKEERKELLYLSQVMIPKDWSLQLKKDGIQIRTPENLQPN